MNPIMNIVARLKSIRRHIYLVFILLGSTGLALLALVAPTGKFLWYETHLKVGDVAPKDYVAPASATFESAILTQQQQESAVSQVPLLYTPADPSVARQQLEHLRSTMSYITTVRADTYASANQKLADLAALADIQLKQETATNILALNDGRWQEIQQEAIVVLERAMGNTIRADQIETARRGVLVLVSPSLPEAQADIVAELVQAFVLPNSQYSAALTENARQKARDSVAPVSRFFTSGEIVVPRGQVLSDADIEAIEELGLAQNKSYWRELDSSIALVTLAIMLLLLYLIWSKTLLQDLRSLTLVAVLFLVFLIGGRLTIPGRTVVPYLFPLMAYSLIMAALFGAEPALVTTIPLAILVSFGLPNALNLTLFYILSGYFGVLVLRRAQRISSFVWSGVAIALSGTLVILAYHLMQGMDWLGLATLIGAALFNGIASASLSILLQFLLSQFLGMTPPLQLIELSRPDHPLLQFILSNAPGTYQHSLQVANLAEQAAERIGADPLLTRVGALYHDAGKALNPDFFIENQIPGELNPHNDRDPVQSASSIIQHVQDGLEIARKYRLPRRIQAFIPEHHGTMLTRYQYIKAVEAAGGKENKVDAELFRYPGPRPQSRETALIMLADACEAQVRAERPKDENELRQLIRNAIDARVKSGQLDNTELTLRDLDTICDSFAATLRGLFHRRILYPKLKGESKEPARRLRSEVPTAPKPGKPHDQDIP